MAPVTEQPAPPPVVPADAPSRLQLGLCLFAVYVIWGSTFFAIKLGLETLPPFLLAGTRFLLAGVLVLGWQRWHGHPFPTARQWWNGVRVGGLLLTVGNGGVVFAEQFVPSGLAAVIIASVPLWATLFSLRTGARPALAQWLGVGLGLAGVAVLNLEGDLRGNPWAAGVLALAAMSWAFGTVWSKRLDLPPGPSSSAVQMVGGGVWLLLLSLVQRESFPADPSTRSLLAWVYLVVFGSLVAFSAYVYLVRHTTATVATSYAYVNPVVAVVLGVGFGGETLGAHALLALPLVLAGIVLVLRPPRILIRPRVG